MRARREEFERENRNAQTRVTDFFEEEAKEPQDIPRHQLHRRGVANRQAFTFQLDNVQINDEDVQSSEVSGVQGNEIQSTGLDVNVMDHPEGFKGNEMQSTGLDGNAF